MKPRAGIVTLGEIFKLIYVYAQLWTLFLRKRTLADEKPESLFIHKGKLGYSKKRVSGVKVKHGTLQNINLVLGDSFIDLWLLAKAGHACSPLEHCTNGMEGCVLSAVHVLQHFENLAWNPWDADWRKKGSEVFSGS